MNLDYTIGSRSKRMIKVKCIETKLDRLYQLEREINYFLSKSPTIELIDIKYQSHWDGRFREPTHSAMIIYKENEHEI